MNEIFMYYWANCWNWKYNKEGERVGLLISIFWVTAFAALELSLYTQCDLLIYIISSIANIILFFMDIGDKYNRKRCKEWDLY